MSFLRSAVHLQASKIVQAAAALVASMLLARSLGPAGFGGYAVLLATMVVVQGLTSFGFEDFVLARGPLRGGDGPGARALYRRALLCRAGVVVGLAGLAGAVWAHLVPDVLPHTTSFALGCALLYAALNSLATLGAVIQAARVRPGPSAALDTVWSLGTAATVAILHGAGGLNLDTAMAVLVAWQAATNIGYVLLLAPVCARRSGVASAQAVPEDAAPLPAREALMFWANGLLSIGVGKSTDVLAMQIAGAPAAPVGRYSASYNANLTASQTLLQGTGTMLYVRLGRVFGSGPLRAAAAAWQTTVLVATLLSGPMLIYCMCFPRTVLVALYGPQFAAGAPALVALAALGLGSRILGGGANQSILFLAGRQAQVLIVRTCCVALNIGLDIALYRLAGIVGVALASGACGLAIVLLELILSRRVIEELAVPWRRMTAVVLPYAAVAMAIRLLAGDPESKVFLVLSALVVMGLGSALLRLTRPLRETDLPASGPTVLRRVLRAISSVPTPAQLT